jgi:hypothetical protein
MVHSLAARAIVRDLEEGTSCIHALGQNATATQKEMLKRLGVQVVNSEGKKYTDAQLSSKHVTQIAEEQILDIAMRYSLSSKYTSWVAIDEDTHQTIIHDKFEGPQGHEEKALFGSSALFGSLAPFAHSAPPMLFSAPMMAKAATSIHVPRDALPVPAFGPSSYPAFGASSVPAFGTPSGRAFGAASVPAFSAHQLEGNESEEPGTATDPHSRLRSILQHQSFDGSFPLVPEIAAFFSTTMEDLQGKLAEVRRQCALSTLSESEWETVWATCLTVEFMKKQLPELQDEWELVVEKAEKRVEMLLRSAQDMATIKEAAAGVATAAGSCASSTTPVVGDVPSLIGIGAPATAAGSGEQCTQDVLDTKEAGETVATVGDAQGAP